MLKKILVAKVTSVHGIKGHAKLKSFTENPVEIFEFERIIDEQDNQHKIKQHGIAKDLFIVSVNDINTRNDIEKIIGLELYINRDTLKNTEDEDDFYHVDLLDKTVYDYDKNSKLGTVKAVHNFGGGDIIEISFFEKNNDNYIAFTKENFPKIDLKNKKVYLKKQDDL